MRSVALTVALVAVMLSGVAALPGRATTWLPPARPLSDDEKLELAVSESDAVGLGYVVAIHNSILESGFEERWIILRPTTWLSGGVAADSVRVGISMLDTSPVFSDLLLAGDLKSTPALFFLNRVGSGWGLREYPVPPPLRLLSPGEVVPTQQRVLRAVACQTPDTLLARADLVVLGVRGAPDARCATNSGIRECASVSVKEVLAGPAVSDSLTVYSVVLGHMPPGEALYLLRKTSDGLYETVGFRNGSQPVRNGKVGRWGFTLADLRTKVREVRAAGPGPGR